MDWSTKVGPGMANPGAWTLTVQSAKAQTILCVLVETLSALEASFSALEGLAGGADGATSEASAFSLLAVTKVLRESNRAAMLESLLVVVVFIGGDNTHTR